MNKNLLFYLIFSLLLLSCGNTNETDSTKTNFKQSKVLSHNSKFDIDALNFNEDVRLLFSKSLDTVNNDYSLKNLEKAKYPTKEDKEENKRFVYTPEDSYFLESLPLDSIAVLDGIYCNKVAVETTKNLKINTFLAYADFYTTKELDEALHKLYLKYGKTTKMKEQERIDTEYDRRREITRDKPKNYEKYLYQYNKEGYAYTGKYHYNEWVLDDCILQIKIYEDFETELDLVNGESKTKNFHTIEFLFIKKEAYNTIKKTLFDNMKKYKHGFEILKPYKIKSLSYEDNYSDYLSELERIEEAKLEAEYQRSLKKQ